MNYQDAKKRVYRSVYILVEGNQRGIVDGASAGLNEKDTERCRKALDEITQSLYDRSSGNLRPHCGEPR